MDKTATLSDGERLDERTNAFEKIGRVRLTSPANFPRMAAWLAGEVARQAARLLSLARDAGRRPVAVRVAMTWDRAVVKHPHLAELFRGGTAFNARVEVYGDVGGAGKNVAIVFETAAFLVVVVELPEDLHFMPGTPPRAQASHDWAAASARALADAWPNDPGDGAVALHVYAGTAWATSLPRWQGSPDDRLDFADPKAFEWFFAASTPR